MNAILALLAVVGVLGAFRLLLRAGLALGRHGLQSYVRKAVAQASAQRGDLTGLSETAELQRRQRMVRFRRWGEFLGVLALLIVPPLTPYTQAVYATYTLFWFLPRAKAKP